MRKEEAEAIFGRGDLGPIESYLEAVATERHLPAFAIGMCLLRMEEAAPALHAVLAKAAAGERLSDDETNLLFRGVYILGGARDAASCQSLLKLLRRPGEELDDLFGDALMEGFSRIVAGVFDGNVDALFDLIADRSADGLVREVLLGAAAFLTWNGSIPRERMRQLLEEFLERGLAEDRSPAWSGWLQAIAVLGFRDMAPLAERAWREGRVDDWALTPDKFEEMLSKAEQTPNDATRFEEVGLGYIADVLVALEAVDFVAPDELDEALDEDDFPKAPMEPIRNPWRQVGRNDPCPCGSGKKAKKCCLANNS